MKTLISGHAGVAVLIDPEQATSFHHGGPQNVARRSEEIARLFGDAPDVIAVEDLTPETIPRRLDLEWSRNRCLLLCLLLLDKSGNPEARLTAVRDIEEFLADQAVWDFIADRFYAAPLPESADLPGSIALARERDAGRLTSLLEEIGAAQDKIARCREAWDELPFEIFGGQPGKEAVAFELVQAGAFRQLAASSSSVERLGLFGDLLRNPSLRRLEGARIGIRDWIVQFARKGKPLRVDPQLRPGQKAEGVFISYAREDQARAAELTNHLRSEGICVFNDPLAGAVPECNPFVPDLLDSPTHVIVLLSDHWFNSGEVLDEFDLTRQCGAEILPVVLESGWGVTVQSKAPFSDKSPVVWEADARVDAIAGRLNEFISPHEKQF